MDASLTIGIMSLASAVMGICHPSVGGISTSEVPARDSIGFRVERSISAVTDSCGADSTEISDSANTIRSNDFPSGIPAGIAIKT
jgi:hypothetical protein